MIVIGSLDSHSYGSALEEASWIRIGKSLMRIFWNQQIRIMTQEEQVKKLNCLLCLAQVHTEAERIFQSVGKQLKQRRGDDAYESLYSYLQDPTSEDPAAENPELARQLEEQSRAAKKKLDEVFDHFVEREVDKRKAADEEEKDEEEEEADAQDGEHKAGDQVQEDEEVEDEEQEEEGYEEQEGWEDEEQEEDGDELEEEGDEEQEEEGDEEQEDEGDAESHQTSDDVTDLELKSGFDHETDS